MTPLLSKLIWRASAAALLALPVLLLANALFMLRDLERSRGAFLRNKAAEFAARLEQVSAEQLLEEEPALDSVDTYDAADAASDPNVQALFDGRELFRIEDGGKAGFRAWVPFHRDSSLRVARLDLNPAAADFLTAGPRRNLYLSITAAVALMLLTGYSLWAREKHARLARLAEIGQMSAVLAHEIRNPLGAMKGFLQLAEERSTGEARMWLTTALEQASRLERVVRDLLLYARAPQPKLSDVAWRVMEDRLRPHAPEARFSGVDFMMRTDPDLLEQALLNLLRNAQEAGTEVRVEAEAGRIRIIDNGDGIPAEVRAKLFQPFVTTKAQGTGLGLAIVKNLARALGADIQLNGAQPKGTCAEYRWNSMR